MMLLRGSGLLKAFSAPKENINQERKNMEYYKTIESNNTRSSTYGRNEVYADENYYYIKSPKKDVYLIIDKDDDTLDFLENCISEYGCLHSTNSTHTFAFCREHYGKKERIYVSHLLLSYYKNKNLNKSERIIHINGNHLNCTRNNLVGYGSPLRLKRKSITITTDKEYIYITHKATGIQFVTNYEPDLLRLIGSKRISWSLANSKDYKGGKDYNRLCGEVFFNKKKCKMPATSLSELVYGYYHYNVSVSNLTSALRSMKKDLRKRKKVVEHLMVDELNNTKANLSVSDEVTNSKKKVIDGKVQPPYYLIMAYKNGVYKAVVCFGSDGVLYVNPIITAPDLESLLNTLKDILSQNVFGEFKSALQWHRGSGVKKYNLTDGYKVQRCLYDNFDDELADIKVAEYISSHYSD